MTDPPKSSPAVQPQEGTWPLGVHRAFVAGAGWWQFHANGATMFPSERDEAEAEAVRRYGEVPAPAVQPEERAALATLLGAVQLESGQSDITQCFDMADAILDAGYRLVSPPVRPGT